MSIKEEIVKVSHLIYQNKFVTAYDGNISAKSESGSIFITRSKVCKGELTIDDILEIDIDGNLISGIGKISTENKLHCYIYANRKDVKAVVHCHPIYSTAFSLVGQSFSENYFPEFVLSLGKVPLCKYATPSTDEVTNSIKDFVKTSNALLLENHGAKLLGKPRTLTDREIEKLLSIAESYYGHSNNEFKY